MKPHDLTLKQLLRELEEARLQEAVLEATGEDLLDRARNISQAVELKVRQATGAGELSATEQPTEAEDWERGCPPRADSCLAR
jgi:hypothetical protein